MLHCHSYSWVFPTSPLSDLSTAEAEATAAGEGMVASEVSQASAAAEAVAANTALASSREREMWRMLPFGHDIHDRNLRASESPQA